MLPLCLKDIWHAERHNLSNLLKAEKNKCSEIDVSMGQSLGREANCVLSSVSYMNW